MKDFTLSYFYREISSKANLPVFCPVCIRKMCPLIAN